MDIGVLSDINNYMSVAGIIFIIFLCLVFQKAGECWWKALIPLYNVYILFRICWNTSKFWIYLLFIITAIIVSVLLSISSNYNINDIISMIGTIVLIVIWAAIFIITAMINLKLSYSFGHGVLFGVGLILLPFIFVAILALDKSKYLGPQH